ncbi:MAG: AFG1/ZapE family ATPase [Salinivenus sp.]
MALPSSLALPSRLETATFDRYEPQSPSQAEALAAAQRFVANQRHASSPSWAPPWATDLTQWITGTDVPPPQGLYLVGPPGTGKTHLLAAAYNALTPEVPCAFLHSSTLFRQTDPPAAVAHRLANRAAVCCLDEVEIDDPANEMRLIGTMNTLADRGVPLLATSNVTPGTHLSQAFSGDRFQRFLRRSFQEQYRVVSVTGADYRRTQEPEASAERAPGRGWIGPARRTRPALQRAHAAASGSLRWWTFDALRTATTETAHSTLIRDLTQLDHLFVEGISIADSDDAFRLLRLIDALYLHADAPTLSFTAPAPPSTWFHPDDHEGVARAVAEKFDRTVSRLHALCEIRVLSSDSA